MARRSRLDRLRSYHLYDDHLSDRDIEAILCIKRSRETTTQLIALLRAFGNQHLEFEPASFRDIREIIRSLDLGRRDLVFDVGAGYGHFVCYGACVTEARFAAVEIVPERCAAIRRSVARLGLSGVCVLEADAETLSFDGATVLFINSPFFADKAERVIAGLSAGRRSRPLLVVAMNNIVGQFRDNGSFRELPTTAQIAPYRFGVFALKSG
jgi:hypothetical protein